MCRHLCTASERCSWLFWHLCTASGKGSCLCWHLHTAYERGSCLFWHLCTACGRGTCLAVIRSAVAGVHTIACELQLCVHKALQPFQVMHASDGVWNHYCTCGCPALANSASAAMSSAVCSDRALTASRCSCRSIFSFSSFCLAFRSLISSA